MISANGQYRARPACLHHSVYRGDRSCGTTNPDHPRPFRTPLVPWLPVLGIIMNAYMMYKAGLDVNWIRLIAWLLVGLVVYFFYTAANTAGFSPIPLELHRLCRENTCLLQLPVFDRDPGGWTGFRQQSCAQANARASATVLFPAELR